jgi:hypothetical protein
MPSVFVIFSYSVNRIRLYFNIFYFVSLLASFKVSDINSLVPTSKALGPYSIIVHRYKYDQMGLALTGASPGPG